MINLSLRFYKLSAICALACILAILSTTQTAFGAVISHTVCNHKSDPNPRVIEVNYLKSQGTVPCSVYYAKNKKNTMIATYKRTIGECERIEKSIISNISKGGWTCAPTIVNSKVKSSKVQPTTVSKTAKNPPPVRKTASRMTPETSTKEAVKTVRYKTPKAIPETALEISLGTVPEKPPGIFNFHSSPPQQFTENNSFAVILEAFPGEEDAHIFVARLRQDFPEFIAHIYKLSSKKTTWVIIGASFLSMDSALTIETKFKNLNIGNPATIDLRGIAPNPGFIETIKLQG